MRRTDALILGGGPAGSAAAIRLAKAGQAVTLIERRTDPGEGVCGGFLGPDGMAALAALGLSPPDIDARPIRSVRMFDGRDQRQFVLPFAAHGISRAVMDQALLDRARREGVAVRCGIAVRALEDDGARLSNGETLGAGTVMLATGKHPLRGIQRRGDAAGKGAVGIRWTIRPSPQLMAALDGSVDLIAFRGGYAGLLLRGDGTANLCLSVGASRVAEAGGIDGMIERLGREQPVFASWCDQEQQGERNSVADVPYGWRARVPAMGAYRLGDQAAVIASIVGDGMAIALNSGIIAADAVVAADGPDHFQARFARMARRPLALAQALRWGAERSAPRRVMIALATVAPGWVARAASATRIIATAPPPG